MGALEESSSEKTSGKRTAALPGRVIEQDIIPIKKTRILKRSPARKRDVLKRRDGVRIFCCRCNKEFVPKKNCQPRLTWRRLATRFLCGPGQFSDWRPIPVGQRRNAP